LVCLFAVATVGFLYAENQKPLDEVISEIAAARRQNPHAGFDRQEIVRNYGAKAVVTQARSLVQDPNHAVRDFGYTLLTDAGMASGDSAVRQMVVDLKVSGIGDKEESISTAHVNGLLIGFQKREDYSDQAKDTLRRYFDVIMETGSRDQFSHDIILLIGVADIQEEMGRLQTIIDQVEGPLNPFRTSANTRQQAMAASQHKLAFSALRAKARMGDEEAIRRCISLVESEADEDFKVEILLDRLSYVRQPAVVDYIKQFLYSDKSRDVDPLSHVIVLPYSYRAVLCFEKMIVGFPERAVIANHIMRYGFDNQFREKWPTYATEGTYMAHVRYCRQWLEAQSKIELIR